MAEDPVIARTIQIITNWKLESIPQRSFNLFMLQIYHLAGQLKKMWDYIRVETENR